MRNIIKVIVSLGKRYKSNELVIQENIDPNPNTTTDAQSGQCYC